MINDEIHISKIASILNIGPVFVSGPTGIGKTTIARKVAEHLSIPFVEIHCGEISEPEDFFYTPSVVDGTLYFKETQLAKLSKNCNEFLVLLDEFNRVQNERALNLILGMLDFRREVRLEKSGETYSFSNAKFIATFNVSDDFTFYTGTVQLDPAIMSRFIRYQIEAPDWKEVANEPAIGRVAAALVGYPVSYRQIDFAEKLLEILPIDEAIRCAFSSIAPSDVLEEVMRNAI